MPGPRKKPQKTDPPPENSSKKKQATKRLQISVAMPTLSALDEKMSDQVISEVKTNIFNSINDAELQKALDRWIKDNHTESKILNRDYHLLKSVITEYLDSYVLFGYNTEGERIIIQHAESARDRDAAMEFLKTIFIQQQQSNFLDIESDEEE